MTIRLPRMMEPLDNQPMLSASPREGQFLAFRAIANFQCVRKFSSGEEIAEATLAMELVALAIGLGHSRTLKQTADLPDARMSVVVRYGKAAC